MNKTEDIPLQRSLRIGKATLIDHKNHLVLKTSHPSPLSAHRGFLGSRVFVKCNEYLEELGREPIVW